MRRKRTWLRRDHFSKAASQAERSDRPLGALIVRSSGRCECRLCSQLLSDEKPEVLLSALLCLTYWRLLRCEPVAYPT
jgi:hypothetical protein